MMVASALMRRVVGCTLTAPYTKLIAGETIVLLGVIGSIIAHQRLPATTDYIAILIGIFLFIASAVGGVLIGLRIRQDVELPVARHLRQETTYHVLMGFSLASVPGAMIGTLGDGTGLMTACIAWIVWTFPLTALLLSREANQFIKESTTEQHVLRS